MLAQTLNDEVFFKWAAGLSSGGGLIVVLYYGKQFVERLIDKQIEKDKSLGESLEKFGADMKASMAELRGAIDRQGDRMVQMDRDHTEQRNQYYDRLYNLNEKQGGVIVTVIGKVEKLEDRVEQLSDRMDENFEKLERSLPGAFPLPPSSRPAHETPEKPRSKLEPPRTP